MGGGAAGPKELGKVWRLADIHIYLCARQCEASPKVISGLCSWKRKAAPSSLKMEKPRNPLGGDHTNVAAPGSATPVCQSPCSSLQGSFAGSGSPLYLVA
ncbi:hypothetical protein MJT46_015219 [Ovis ammon polii x Ovis aries]|nr:hypothetical protein MJT46_015219 [Ovis ammon polii x Ovis aries]